MLLRTSSLTQISRTTSQAHLRAPTATYSRSREEVTSSTTYPRNIFLNSAPPSTADVGFRPEADTQDSVGHVIKQSRERLVAQLQQLPGRCRAHSAK